MNEFDFLHQSLEKPEQETSSVDLTSVPQIFLVEDDQALGRTLKKFLEKKFFAEIHFFESPSQLFEELDRRIVADPKNKERPFLLVTDLTFEVDGADGLLLIDMLKERGFNFVSILMTGFASIESAINATKKGVLHYLTKPFDLDVLGNLVQKALKKMGFDFETFEIPKLSQTPTKLINVDGREQIVIEKPSDDDIFCGMIGRSSLMKEVFERIKKVAQTDSTVLITGPSGTGKELVSNAIHNLSLRKDHPKVSVNCGAIPGELLESELFGHEKGAFTGAVSSRKGRFEMANTGTIFLDEIGDMPLLLQVKLLRVLQNREIERVGSTETTPINVRIITATHRDLEKQVSSGDFREDLFYRLNVIPVRIPGLAERREDIPLLISYFLSRFVSADGRNSIEFDSEALDALLSYDWPGNVRELENLIERLVILKGGSIIKLRDLPAKFLESRPGFTSSYQNLISLPENGIDLKSTLTQIEDSLILQALEKTNGNKNRASKLLSMNRTTLIEKMKKKPIFQEFSKH